MIYYVCTVFGIENVPPHCSESVSPMNVFIAFRRSLFHIFLHYLCFSDVGIAEIRNILMNRCRCRYFI